MSQQQGWSMSQRSAGASVMDKVLELQHQAPRHGLLARARARLVGRDPLVEGARSWYAGALGEVEVATLLAGLGQGWHVLHAVPVGRGKADVDHVVIGPPGVVVVNTKHHPKAWVYVNERSVFVSGRRVDWLDKSLREADQVGSLLDPHVPGGVDVRAVVAVVGADSLKASARPANHVVVISSRDLVEHLRALPRRLNARKVDELMAVADDPSTWGLDAGVAMDDPGAAFAKVDARVRRARARREDFALGMAGLFFALAAVIAVVLGNYVWALLHTFVPVLRMLS